jgi:hypothetical protein
MKRTGECEPTVKCKCTVDDDWLHAYLDLKKVVAADPLVVHLMVGIVGITATLILHERKALLFVS